MSNLCFRHLFMFQNVLLQEENCGLQDWLNIFSQPNLIISFISCGLQGTAEMSGVTKRQHFRLLRIDSNCGRQTRYCKQIFALKREDNVGKSLENCAQF